MNTIIDIPSTDIPIEEALELAKQELGVWVRTKYLLEKRLAVMDKQGLNGEVTQPLLKNLTESEIAIEMWKQEVINLQKSS